MRVKDLAPHPKNPRTISDQKLKQLKKALIEFGDLSGIVFNRKSGQLVGGHQRAKHLDADTPVTITKTYSRPTKTGTVAEGYVLLDGERFSYREVSWDKHKEMAANIAANKGAGSWDLPELGEWIKELSSFDVDFDMDLTMFDEDELEEQFEGIVVREHTRVGATGVDEDDVPEKAPPRTKPGDIYRLGNHRLMCGDSTNEKQVARLMKDSMIDLFWTDPPYNVALGMETPEQARARNRRTDGLVVMNDKMPDDKFREFLFKVFTRALEHARPGCGIYVAHADSEGYNFRGAAKDAGWSIKQCLIWKKSSLVMGRQDYHWIHEPILYGWKEGAAHSWYSDRKQTTVLEFAKPSRNGEHPTMKPVELVQYCLENSSKVGDNVLDLFGGSGTTLIASEKIDRNCFMMELDPAYCDVIVERWEKYTGKKAKLIATAKDKPLLKKPAKQDSKQDALA
jgi:DNA modification methylase